MNIRLATRADLEAMTWVLIGASPLDPVYPYRFPDRHLYPGEFAALCRRKCAEYLETSTVVVCEMASHDDDEATQVVAFSAWDMPTRVHPQASGALGTYRDVTPLVHPPSTNQLPSKLTADCPQNQHTSPQPPSRQQPSGP